MKNLVSFSLIIVILLGITSCTGKKYFTQSVGFAVTLREHSSKYEFAGYGWVAGATIKLYVLNPPGVSGWKDLNTTVIADVGGAFGTVDVFYHYIEKDPVCGIPDGNDTVMFLAKDEQNNTYEITVVSVAGFYTNEPC